MAKKIKIFIVTGVFVNFEQKNHLTNELHTIVGYFTNLKELYKNFEKGSVQSYTTICSHINKQGFYISNNSRFLHSKTYQNFNELIIRQVETNMLYSCKKDISLSELLSKEVSSIDIHLGMNLSRGRTIEY